MVKPTFVQISFAVEGLLDEAVLRRLIEFVGAAPGFAYAGGGKPHLRNSLDSYIGAARFSPWVVLVDLNTSHECAPELRKEWVTTSAPFLCFRVAVREVEAWLLADRERLAAFLSVRVARFPREPEQLDDPKRTLLDLARESRKPRIRSDMIPRPRSGRGVGAAYNELMIEFAARRWRPEVAAPRADSLRRCIADLRSLVDRWRRRTG